MAEIKINTFPTGLTYSRNTKAPLESNRLFDTLALAQAYVDNVDQNAYVGLTIAVIADGENNGLYYIEQIADENNTTGTLRKITSDFDQDIETLQSDIDALKSTIGTSESGLVADVTVIQNTLSQKANAFTVDNGLSYANDKLGVVVSTVSGNALTVTDEGLYVATPDIPEYELLTVSEPSSEYASQYQFKKDGIVLNTINIPKDQFLKSASYDHAEKKLIFVFDTTTGETTQEVSVADLVDTYSAGDYITISDSTISVNYESLKSKINEDLVAPVSTSVSTLQQTADDHEERIADLESIEHPTKAQVTALETNYNTINQSVADLTAIVQTIKVKDVDTTASSGVSLKLDNVGKIGVNVDIDTLATAVIEKHDGILNAENINTVDAVGPNEAGASIQTVLENLNSRILPAVTSVAAGDGIEVDTSDVNNPKVSVKIASGSALNATTEGLDLIWTELA